MPPKTDKPKDCSGFENSRNIFAEFLRSQQTSADIITLNKMCQNRICPIRSQCINLICNGQEAEKRE